MEIGDKIGVWDKFDVNLLHKEQIGWKAMRIYQGFGINLTDLKSRSWCTFGSRICCNAIYIMSLNAILFDYEFHKLKEQIGWKAMRIYQGFGINLI